LTQQLRSDVLLGNDLLSLSIYARNYDDLNFQLSLIALALQSHLGVARST
jgi:hypothetical protein